MDCYECQRIDFEFVYYQSLLLLFHEYCALLNIEKIPFYQITRYISDSDYLSTYLKAPFPDEKFSEMFLIAIGCKEQDIKIKMYEEL